jgi:proline iminopeptidase
VGGTVPMRGRQHLVRTPAGPRLWCRVTGTGPGAVIVPTTGNDGELDALDDARHQVVFHDLRGRGHSDPVKDVRRRAFAETVADIELVRRDLGIETFSAVGWSWIAGALVTYAAQHPGRVERLVLVSPLPCRSGVLPRPVPPAPPDRLAALDQLQAAGLRVTDPVAYCRAWRTTHLPPMLGDPAAFERLADVSVLPNEWPWHSARHLVSVFTELCEYDWRPLLRSVPVPALVVHGTLDQDPLSVAEEWVDALPDGRLLPVEGAGPMPWVERPDVFFRYVNRFLAGEPV